MYHLAQCIAFKTPNRFPAVPTQRNFIPTRPMELVSCDHIGKLQGTDKGNYYILSFLDHFTKYMKLYAVSNQTAESTAEKFLDFVSIFGLPEKLLTDRGTAFTSDLFKILCKRLGVSKLFTTPLHPATNGQSEVINKGIKKSLSIFAQNTPNWDNYVNYYAMIYNSSIHSATKEKPSFLHFGYDQLLPSDITHNSQTTTKCSYPDYIGRKTAEMQYVYKQVHEHLVQAADKQETYQHKKAKERNFHIGQLVYLFSPDADRNLPIIKKRNYSGPFSILTKHNNVDFTVIDALDPRKKAFKVHANRLISFPARKPHLNIFKPYTETKDTNNDFCYQKPQTDNLQNVYEELDDNDLYYSQTIFNGIKPGPSLTIDTSLGQEGTHTNSGDNSTPFSHVTEPTQIHDDENTIIYTPPRISPQTSVSTDELDSQTSFNRSPYNLRSKNVADRFFDWILKMTE